MHLGCTASKRNLRAAQHQLVCLPMCVSWSIALFHMVSISHYLIVRSTEGSGISSGCRASAADDAVSSAVHSSAAAYLQKAAAAVAAQQQQRER